MRKQFSEEGQGKARRRFSIKGLVLTGALSLLLGVILTLSILWIGLGKHGVSVMQAMYLVSNQFIGDYEWEDVVDGTLKGMVLSLDDRWSYYLDKDQYLATQDTRRNAYTGIGITISNEKGNAIQILTVTEGGPADQAGLKAREDILSVAGTPVTEETWDDCVDLIRGEAGTTVSLLIRDEAGDTRTVEVLREEIVTISVEREMLPGNIGLITLRNFYSGSAAALISNVDALMEEGATAIIFDVRDNPGGYVTELTKMLDHLLPEGVIFVSRDVDGNEVEYTSSEDTAVNLPFAVIINTESYSAAEFFAAQLRESVQAVVVGEVTSGKGYAQQLFPLLNGSALGLSTSRYYTGEGVSLIGTGVVPDTVVELSYEEYVKHLQKELSYAEDPQLQAAMEALQ